MDVTGIELAIFILFSVPVIVLLAILLHKVNIVLQELASEKTYRITMRNEFDEFKSDTHNKFEKQEQKINALRYDVDLMRRIRNISE